MRSGNKKQRKKEREREREREIVRKRKGEIETEGVSPKSKIFVRSPFKVFSFLCSLCFSIALIKIGLLCFMTNKPEMRKKWHC